MRHLFYLYCCFLLFFAGMLFPPAAHAQQLHFIYIQTDNKQPFSVKLNSKYYSSSATGYIILSKLTDGTYSLAVNFAKNSYPEQAFTLTVAGKDYGYALKNFNAKGWGLFNFQTTDVVMNNAATPVKESSSTVTNTSAFGNMLADVVNDKSINTLAATDTITTAASKTLPATAGRKPVDSSAAITTNTAQQTVAATNAEIPKAIAKEDSIENNTTPAFNTTGVIKAEENTGDKGTNLTFIDFDGTHSDTIKAFIPVAGEKNVPANTDTAHATAKLPAVDSAAGNVSNPLSAPPAATDSAVAAAAKPVFVENSTSIAKPSGTAPGSSGCANMVSDGDLRKLKKRIVSQTDQDAILLLVKKSLKNKCISTAQVKDLGNLFLNDDNRYGFYDAVYPFVYDFSSYASLENTLIDPYYKTRFKALLR